MKGGWLSRRAGRVLVTFVPMLVMLLHATSVVRLEPVSLLEQWFYDWRLRAGMPRRLDSRIVIVDIDEAGLRQEGQWPWPRERLARMVDELFERQHVAALALDLLFIEPDARSVGAIAQRLRRRGEPADSPRFRALDELAPLLDDDGDFARALAGRPVVLGFYFQTGSGLQSVGELPSPLLRAPWRPDGLQAVVPWAGYSASLPALSKAAGRGGFLNVLIGGDSDAELRSVPLLAAYGPPGQQALYESLALATYRLVERHQAPPGLVYATRGPRAEAVLSGLLLPARGGGWRLPVDSSASMLVPFRGPGGPRGGSFRYVSAADLLNGRLAPDELSGRVVLVGTTAPGLQDLRPTPVQADYPGVEIHASVLSALLDRRGLGVPDYAAGYEVSLLVLGGLAMAFGATLLPFAGATLLALGIAAAGVMISWTAQQQAGVVLPLASLLLMVVAALLLNLAWAYFVEARAGRALARLFGTYVPPELVERMRLDPQHYGMGAENKVLTVLFCDMRGFTQLCERLEPAQLQALLNDLLDRFSQVIRRHHGTIDKFMGDCVMAFWGAPVDQPEHASMAIAAALDICETLRASNLERQRAGLPAIEVGIGVNTGVMSVGDMGSMERRSYTVIGDPVNLAARLESLGARYGVEIVAGELTARAATNFLWRELDQVQVRGKAQPVRIFTPVALQSHCPPGLAAELEAWHRFLAGYRDNAFEEAGALLDVLRRDHAENVLYRFWAERLASGTLAATDRAGDPAGPEPIAHA